MDFYITRCPNCRTAFRTTPAQLSIANGRVRCGACLTVFNATDNGPEDTIRARMAELDLSEIPEQERLEPENLTSLDRVRDSLELPLAPGNRRMLQRIGQSLLALLLIFSLALQYLWHNRLVLAQDPDRRHLAGFACSLLRCELPPLSDIAALSGEDLLIRSHPEQEGMLVFALTIGNTAAFAQPFPTIELVFRDTNQNDVARLLITPADYLPEVLGHQRLMDSGSTFQLQHDLEDPGEHAINYEVTFLPYHQFSD